MNQARVRVTLEAGGLVAELSDGVERTTLRGSPEDLARHLAALGIEPEQVAMPDWREGQHAPFSGHRIAFFTALRKAMGR